MRFRQLFSAALLLSLSHYSAFSVAGISLDGTRIIFSSTDVTHGQTIGVSSSTQSETPYLVKAQVLADTAGQNTATPFSVTPSLFRLEPGTTNQLRIIKTGRETLANDKESLYYFRVIATPAGKGNEPDAKSELGGSLMISTGSVIKLFYRPAGLSMTQQQAMASLKFTRQGSSLKINNPSPYYITLSSLDVAGKKVSLNSSKKNKMISPFGQVSYPDTNAVGKVTWQAINDFGVTEEFNGSIN